MRASAVLISAFLVLIFLSFASSAQEENQSIEVTVKITYANAEIEALTVNPLEAYQNQDVEFIVTVRNTSTVPIWVQPTSKIEILRGGALVDTIYITSSETNIPVGEKFDFVLGWNTDNHPPGAYSVKATVDYDNRTTSLTGEFSIMEVPLPPPEVPPPPPVIVAEENLLFESFPPLVEFEPGETRFMRVILSNRTVEALQGITVEAISQDNWATVIPRVLNLSAGGSATLNVQVMVPSDAVPADYGLRVRATHSSTGSQAEMISLLRVKPVAADRVSVLRTVEIDRLANTTKVTLRVRNGSKRLDQLELVENIKKGIVSSVYEVSFDTMPTKVLEPDPVVKWVFEDLAPYEQRTVSYTVPTVIDFESYVYWPVKQLTVVYSKVPHLLEVMDLAVPAMEPGGTAAVAVTVINVDTVPHDVVARLAPPSGWLVTPGEISARFMPRTAYVMTFRVTSQPGISPGIYMGFLTLVCEEEITTYVTFYVSPPAAAIFPVVEVILLLLAAFLAYLLLRRILRRRDSQKVMGTLLEVKKEAG